MLLIEAQFLLCAGITPAEHIDGMPIGVDDVYQGISHGLQLPPMHENRNAKGHPSGCQWDLDGVCRPPKRAMNWKEHQFKLSIDPEP